MFYNINTEYFPFFAIFKQFSHCFNLRSPFH